jgi:hypothetical protein
MRATTTKWDSTVPNHSQIKAGDLIAIWDKESLLGISVIAEIEESMTEAFLQMPALWQSGDQG